MATSSPHFAEIYVQRFLTPAAEAFGISVTPEMESDAIGRVQAWSADLLADPNPEDAEPDGNWEKS